VWVEAAAHHATKNACSTLWPRGTRGGDERFRPHAPHRASAGCLRPHVGGGRHDCRPPAGALRTYIYRLPRRTSSPRSLWPRKSFANSHTPPRPTTETPPQSPRRLLASANRSDGPFAA